MRRTLSVCCRSTIQYRDLLKVLRLNAWAKVWSTCWKVTKISAVVCWLLNFEPTHRRLVDDLLAGNRFCLQSSGLASDRRIHCTFCVLIVNQMWQLWATDCLGLLFSRTEVWGFRSTAERIRVLFDLFSHSHAICPTIKAFKLSDVSCRPGSLGVIKLLIYRHSPSSPTK